jgi:LacI family transcriptional regulator
MVRMKDIAEVCGVSRTTVSLALNNRYGGNVKINEKLRSKIKRTAEKMGYQPNRNAAALTKGRNPAIGIFLPPFRSELVADMVFGMSDSAMEQNYPVFLSSGYTDENFIRFLEKSHKMSSSGIIIYFNFNEAIYNEDFRSKVEKMISTGEIKDFPYNQIEKNNRKFYQTINKYVESGGKVVLLNEVPEIYKNDDCPVKYVACNDEEGGKMAAEHLMERNCRNFYIISSYHRCYRDRCTGYKKALNDAGIECNCLTIWDVSTKTVNTDALKSVFDKIEFKNFPVGLFVPTDFTAITAYEYFKERGLKIGRDIKIIGYDDSEYAKFMEPGLTSIQQHFNQAGSKAMEALMSMLADKDVRSQMIKPELIVREST